MAVLEILTAPHPLLSEKSRPVRPDEFGEALDRRLSDMAETMYAAPGVGLAAVQVGDLRRMLVADLSREDEDDDTPRGTELVKIVNPVIVEASREKITWEEGCLSVPEFWEDITRPRRVLVRYQDPWGQVVERWFEDYHAVIVQHEMDHLDGVILLDRVSRLKRKRYLARVRKARLRAAAEGAL